MTLVSFEAALERADEIELTTTGRVTGKPISCPVWFVRRGEKLYLVPGDGTGSQWYKNLLKTPCHGELGSGDGDSSLSSAGVEHVTAVLAYAGLGRDVLRAHRAAPAL
jgi:F420H(2)-dependent quinone reductase